MSTIWTEGNTTALTSRKNTSTCQPIKLVNIHPISRHKRRRSVHCSQILTIPNTDPNKPSHTCFAHIASTTFRDNLNDHAFAVNDDSIRWLPRSEIYSVAPCLIDNRAEAVLDRPVARGVCVTGVHHLESRGCNGLVALRQLATLSRRQNNGSHNVDVIGLEALRLRPVRVVALRALIAAAPLQVSIVRDS